MLKSIIERFADEYGFVLNFDEVVEYLKNNENFSLKQINKFLLMLNQHNLNIIKNITNEINIQKKINEISNFISFSNDLSKITNIPIKLKKTQEFVGTIDISYYILLISQLLKEGLEYEKLKNILPNYINSDFDNIINTILLHYKKEIITLKQMKRVSEDEITRYIEEEEKELQKLIENIIKYRDSIRQNSESSDFKRINILFDPNTYENDLSSLLIEHYQDFYILLDSLSKNVLKGVKAFTPIGGNKCTTEVRYNNSRILFEKIDNNTYFIYYIFLKKDVDKYYHETLVNRINSYALNKKQLLLDFYDENTKRQFIEENKEVYQKIMGVLGSKGTKGGSEYAKLVK